MQIKRALKRAMTNLRMATETNDRAQVAFLRSFIREYFKQRHNKHVIIK